LKTFVTNFSLCALFQFQEKEEKNKTETFSIRAELYACIYFDFYYHLNTKKKKKTHEWQLIKQFIILIREIGGQIRINKDRNTVVYFKTSTHTHIDKQTFKKITWRKWEKEKEKEKQRLRINGNKFAF